MKTIAIQVEMTTAEVIAGMCERYRMTPAAVVERAVADLAVWCRKREGEMVWNDSTGKQMTMSMPGL